MTNDPRDPVAALPGSGLLAFTSLWFEPAVIASVFEPLVADWQGEARAARTRGAAHWINVRWRLAFLANGVTAVPRLVAVPVPGGLLFDLTLRAIVFGALGFVFQQAFGRRADVVGMAVIDSLPFALLPVVMRLRRHIALPDHAARTLVLQCTMAVALVLSMFAGPAWQIRLGAAAIPFIVGFMGWRLGAARPHWKDYSAALKWWLTMAMLASTWMLAAYPLKLALGIPLMGRFWGSDVAYLLAILLTALLQVDDWRERRRQARSAPTAPEALYAPKAPSGS